jgi:phage shock protein PspC (stress-responsive transcriptional regulator)
MRPSGYTDVEPGPSALARSCHGADGAPITMSEPGSRPPTRLRRSRHDRVLGGVCAGIARSTGVDPVLVRLATVLIALVSGGTAVLAYLLAWVLLPAAADDPDPGGDAASPPPGSAKEAWAAAGHELRSLTAQVRRPSRTAGVEKGGTVEQGDAVDQGSAHPGAGSRPSLRSVDATMSARGERGTALSARPPSAGARGAAGASRRRQGS